MRGLLLLVTLLGAALGCGSTTTVKGEGGAGGTSGSTGGLGGASDGGGPGCSCADCMNSIPECSGFAGCIGGCGCEYYSLGPGAPCNGGVCSLGGQCVECASAEHCGTDELCLDDQCVASPAFPTCGVFADVIAACNLDPDGLVAYCAVVLIDCTAPELMAIEACLQAIVPDCNANALLSCVQGAACASP
ncbi:MAG: hypothetical protein R3B72_20820 [Polyangiaceae bacterium]